MIGLPEDGFLFIDVVNSYGTPLTPLSQVPADIYRRYLDGRRQTAGHMPLDEALAKYPEADVTARVIFAVLIARVGAWTLLYDALRINAETYLFKSDILHAFEALVATEDFDAVLRYAKQTIEASTPTKVFRWLR